MCHFHFPPSLFTFWLPVEIIETSSSSSITTQTWLPLPPLCFLIAIVVTVVVVSAPVFDVVSPYCDAHSSSLSLFQIHCLKVTSNNPFEICLCGMKMVIVDLGDQICHFGSSLSTVYFSL